MTIETRCLIELSDILGVEFQCQQCKGRFLLGTDVKQTMLWQCPICRETWLLPQTEEERTMHNFLNILRSVNAKMQGRNFSVKLLITSPDEPRGINGQTSETRN